MTPHEPNADLLAEITALRERVASLTRENTKLQGALAEASEQQTATSEILRVISGSPTIVQPVLDAVVESAVRLCDAYDARIWRLEGDRMVRAARSGPLMREDGRTWLPLDASLPSTQATHRADGRRDGERHRKRGRRRTAIGHSRGVGDATDA
jgi:hypothetical protein